MRIARYIRSFLLLLLLMSPVAHAGEKQEGWYSGNLPKIDTFVQTYFNKNAVAVFDWDNTVIKNDVGDATFFWMLSHDLIHVPPSWANTSPYLTTAAVMALDKTCPVQTAAINPTGLLPTSVNIPCTDLILSIYNDGVLSDGKTLAWEKSYNADWLEPAYGWVTQLTAGYTPKAIRKIAEKAIWWNLHQPLKATQKLGSKTYPAYIRIYTAMQDLIKRLQANGFDVWIVSASAQPIVEAFADKVGITSDHVIGVRSMTDGLGQITYAFEGCGTILDGNASIITYRQGKRCWINKVIFKMEDPKAMMNTPSPIAFGAGDADTDVFFVKDAQGLHLAINRNKPELMCNAYQNKDGKWIVNPMFIFPKPKKADGYNCKKFGIPNQEDSVYGK